MTSKIIFKSSERFSRCCPTHISGVAWKRHSTMCKCPHQHLSHPNYALTCKTNVLSWLLILVPHMPTKSFRNCQWDHSGFFFFPQRSGDTNVLVKRSFVLLFNHFSLKGKYGKGWPKNVLGRTLCRNCPRSRQWMFQVDQLSSSDARAFPIPEGLTGSGL